MPAQNAILALEDGTVFHGQAFGQPGEAFGEVVFNTSMTGYQEILTDPSYNGQIVTMTYPLIGNTGVNDIDTESVRPQVQGFVIKELAQLHSNYRAGTDLDTYLRASGILAIQGIDTRALTKHIRTVGAQRGVISTEDADADSLVAKAKASPSLVGRDLVKEVTCEAACEWAQPLDDIFGERGEGGAPPAPAVNAPRVVAIDCGAKRNILRHLVSRGCRVTVVPASATADEILALEPDGVMLSNGPGDPEGVPYVIETVKRLLGKTPIFGICLGHQMLSLALGAKTFKLKFGHRGSNQPVMRLSNRKVEITCQNHGFAVDPDTLPDDAEMTHVHLNDQTCSGMRHRTLPAFSVQYHPEASAGPHDSEYLFDDFLKLMEQ